MIIWNDNTFITIYFIFVIINSINTINFIKYIIWLILFSTKKLDYKTISKEYDKLFNWLKQKFPNYKNNKVVRLWKPKGELFSIRLIVVTMSIANKIGLGKALVYIYSIL